MATINIVNKRKSFSPFLLCSFVCVRVYLCVAVCEGVNVYTQSKDIKIDIVCLCRKEENELRPV